MSDYHVQGIYGDDMTIVNYGIYKGDFECVYETLSFFNYLKNVKKRDISTIRNKATGICYWYNYVESTGQEIDSFFTLNEQMEFVKYLETKTNSQRKKKMYLSGANPYEEGLSEKTIRIYLIAINEYYQYLKRNSMISISAKYLPFRKELGIISKEKARMISLPETLSVEEVNRLIDACSTYRDKAIIVTMVSTGMRLGEVAALTLSALDFKTHSVHLRHQYLDLENGVLKTGERELKGSKVMFNAIQKYILFERGKVAKCNNLFVTLKGRNGEPAGYALKKSSLKQMFTRLRKKTGIQNCHAHILRHTFASMLLATKAKNNKVTLAMLQKLMGHKNINTTMIYTHLDYTIDDFKETKEFEEKLNEVIRL